VAAVTAGVLLRSSLFAEDFRTYTSQQTLVPFQLEHPTDWAPTVLLSSDFVLGPDPTVLGDLFRKPGDPTAWAPVRAALQSGDPEPVWAYAYSSAATYDIAAGEELRESLQLLLPATTQLDPGQREVQVAGAPAAELEGTTTDPADAQTRLRLMAVVVQPPGAGGAVLLVFFAAPDDFEDQRATFERVRDSFQVLG
jgi:hypothetical protein